MVFGELVISLFFVNIFFDKLFLLNPKLDNLERLID